MVRVGIVGASGYAGGELLRLLLSHPETDVVQATSERLKGKFVTIAHPNMRGVTDMKFSSVNELEECDVLFLCLPHGKSMHSIDKYMDTAGKVIDLSGDFRLNSPEEYKRWYGEKHPRPELLKEFVYGIPELHREEMSSASLISSAGCNATVSILGLHPLKDVIDPERTVIEVKVGSSEAGNKATDSSHHPERVNSVRSYKPTMHRHSAEIMQELGIRVNFSATSIDLVRGSLATSHVFLKKDMDEKDLWRMYREAYGQEHFIRIVKERTGIYRYPEPKLLAGTNYCDIGFEKDPLSNRVVVISAIDNLVKGAAGQAVQAFNIMHGFPEIAGLGFTGLHP